MCPQTQQLKPTCRSAAHRRDQFLHLPVLGFRVTASDNRPQFALAESSDLRGLVEGKERLSDLFGQSQQVHDLSDTRAGNASRFRDFRHVQIGIALQHVVPLHRQADRMLHRRARHLRVHDVGPKSVNLSHWIREGMSNERPSTPSRERNADDRLKHE